MYGYVALAYCIASWSFRWPVLVWANVAVAEASLYIYQDCRRTSTTLSTTVYFPLFLLLQELYFYYVHRLLHIPLVYRWIHRWHHDGEHDRAYAWYAHPLEHLVLNIGSCAVPAMILNDHEYLPGLLVAIIASSVLSHAQDAKHIRYHHQRRHTYFGNWYVLDWLHYTLPTEN